MDTLFDYFKTPPSLGHPEGQKELDYSKWLTNEIRQFYELEYTEMPSGEKFANAYTKHKDFLYKSLEIIFNHVSDTSFGLNTFIAKANVSKTSLYRSIHALTGHSPYNLILHIRMRYAQLLLMNTSFHIAEIAIKMGFNCPKHFTYCFRKSFGLSPKAFRNKFRQTQPCTVILLNEKQFLQEVINLIEENISDPDFRFRSMTLELGISQSVLYRRIKSVTGLSPSKFIRSVKLNHAMSMLKNNYKNEIDIVYASGFSDPKYFRKCFRDEFGIFPKTGTNS